MPTRSKPAPPRSPYLQAERRLARRDARLRQLIRRVGCCTMTHNPDHFFVLVRTILAQQISTIAANSIGNKLLAAVGGITPAAIAAASDETLRGCGLSGAKMRALRDLCAKIDDGTLPLPDLASFEDDEVRQRIVAVRGLGHWSADMFLMFSLGRPDLLPVGDYGLRAGVKDLYELPELPTPQELTEIAQPWRPHRSIATWYIWRSRGPVPQSK